MITHGHEPLEIGKRYIDEISDHNMVYHKVGFLVIRKASLEELIKYIDENCDIDTGHYGQYIYEISMD